MGVVAETQRRPFWKPLLEKPGVLALIAAAAVLVVISALIWKWPSGFPGKSPAGGAPRVLAVVEIQNLTGDPALDYLGGSVREMLYTDLAQSERLVLISTDRVRSLILRRAREGGELPPGEDHSLSHALAGFYLGELLEQTGKKADAIAEYQKFLSHFEDPPAKLPQVAHARAALKRLSQR